jgi:hypothetical protein
MDKKLRKFRFHYLKSVLGPMVGTVIVMERLMDSLSKPVASLTTRPMTTGSMVERRPMRPPWPHEGRWRSVGQHERAGDHLGCGDGQLGTVGRCTWVAGCQGSVASRAGQEGIVELMGAPED